VEDITILLARVIWLDTTLHRGYRRSGFRHDADRVGRSCPDTDVGLLTGARHKAVSAGRILVVDDDPQIRRVMRVTLTGQGYEVDDGKSGDAALEKLREERFDLVLLDMNMPGRTVSRRAG
jgi:hypothetical protein